MFPQRSKDTPPQRFTSTGQTIIGLPCFVMNNYQSSAKKLFKVDLCKSAQVLNISALFLSSSYPVQAHNKQPCTQNQTTLHGGVIVAVQTVATPKRTFKLFKFNTTKLNLFLDIGLALAFVVELQEHFTGLRNHELIGVGLGIAMLIHIVLHWKWVWNITKTFFRNLFYSSRLSYILNTALLIDMAVITVTGILISRTLGLNLGVTQSAQMTFKSLHVLASNFSLLLVGTHVAIHWKWILSNSKKYLFRITSGKGKATKVPTVPALSLTQSTAQE